MNSTRNARSVLIGALLLPLLISLAPGFSPRIDAAAEPDIPAGSLEVCAGSCQYPTIQAALDAATPGATIAVKNGDYQGPVVIDKAVTLMGVGSPVIDGAGHGTVVRIDSPNVVLQGFVIQNSGSNFDKEDSGVYIEGTGVQILDNQLLNTLFGVNAAQSHDLVIARNRIVGMDVDMGVRGDGIKVWYSHRTQILENHIIGSRDLLVWYSNDVVVRDNTIEQGRYGFHFMNSDNGIAEHNRLFDNSVGIYLMYGKHFTIRDNLLQGSRGPSGHGLGLKEVDGVEVEGNIIYDNRIGVYIDNSPLSPDLSNHFRVNLLAYNDIGLGLLPSSHNNVFSQNSLVDNQEQISVLGSGPLGDNQWSENGLGNFWSDYVGYDANGDGVGDVPYRSEQLSEQLMHSWPVLQLFRFSIAETAVDFGSKAVPMFRQEPKLTDALPLVEPVLPANAAKPAHGTNINQARLIAIALLIAAGFAIFWGWRGTRFKATKPARRPDPGLDDALLAAGSRGAAGKSSL